MTAIKERIIGVITEMDDADAEEVWNLIKKSFSSRAKTWEDIPEVEPDQIDKQMLDSVAKDPDCQAFISSEEAYKELGI